MFSATMLNCGLNPNPNVSSSICIACCLPHVFNYKPFQQQFFSQNFQLLSVIILQYTFVNNLLLKLLYAIQFTNAFVEIFILKVIFKLGAFFVQINPNIALDKVKWNVVK